MASGLAFYRTKAIESSSNKLEAKPFETSSWHLFGGNGLMYERWFPMDQQNNKTLLLIGRNKADLIDGNVLSHIEQHKKSRKLRLTKWPAGWSLLLSSGERLSKPTSYR